MTLYAVGDVHGEIGHLERLLARIRADAAERGVARPRTVFVGDIGDRGAGSRAVYDRLSAPGFEQEFDPVFLLGNHERMLLDAERDPSSSMLWLQCGGAEFVESYGFVFRRSAAEVLREFFAAFPPAHRALLSRMRLWHQEDGYLFVHAGIDPLRPRGRAADDLLWIREPFLSCTEGYGLVVVHGHSPAPEVVVRPNRIGVDTGCGHRPDCPLSAAVLAGGGPPLRVLDSR